MSGALKTIKNYQEKVTPTQRMIGGRYATLLGRSDCQSLLTVITVSFNAAHSLSQTIESVLAQTLQPHIEYIIIDGGSKDGTLDVIRHYEDRISLWISEPDAGISDAFNKGIAYATGKYIAILNADDVAELNLYEVSVAALEDSDYAFSFGNLRYVDKYGRNFINIGDPFYARRIAYVMPVLNHPTVVVRRELYEKHGLFNIRWRYAMDYDLLLRFHCAGERGIYCAEAWCSMSLGGVSELYYKRAYAEVRQIAIQHGGWPAKAWLVYFYAILKSKIRITLTSFVSDGIMHKLRSFFNRSYRESYFR